MYFKMLHTSQKYKFSAYDFVLENIIIGAIFTPCDYLIGVSFCPVMLTSMIN